MLAALKIDVLLKVQKKETRKKKNKHLMSIKIYFKSRE